VEEGRGQTVQCTVVENFALPRINWRILPDQGNTRRRLGRKDVLLIRTMPNTEITEECRALIASIFEPPPGQRLPNGNWRIEIDAATWQWLQRLRLHGESISDCIIRIVVITLHRRGLQ
jgi:hypothetical protein